MQGNFKPSRDSGVGQDDPFRVPIHAESTEAKDEPEAAMTKGEESKAGMVAEANDGCAGNGAHGDGDGDEESIQTLGR
jgi:hypothetical protein